jgi:hypothetical protein
MLWEGNMHVDPGPVRFDLWPKWSKSILAISGYIFIYGFLFVVSLICKAYGFNLWSAISPDLLQLYLTLTQIIVVLLALYFFFEAYDKSAGIHRFSSMISYGCLALLAILLIQNLKPSTFGSPFNAVQNYFWQNANGSLLKYILYLLVDEPYVIQFIVIVIVLQIARLQLRQTSKATRIYLPFLMLVAFVFAGYFNLGHGWFLIPVTGGPPPLEPLSERVITYVTATTGLISAVAGLYGQIIAGRKLRAEIRLMNSRHVTQGKKAKLKKDTKEKTRKKTAKRSFE